jgi:hypothetical protein
MSPACNVLSRSRAETGSAMSAFDRVGLLALLSASTATGFVLRLRTKGSDLGRFANVTLGAREALRRKL